MDLSHFQARLSALGADLSAWPRDEADAAIELLALSDAAVSLLALASAADLAAEPADDRPLADLSLGRQDP